MILAIDPGNLQSAWVVYDPETHRVVRCGIEPNEDAREVFQVESINNKVCIEMVACYGMPVGAEVFDTCVWIGRFIEMIGDCDLLKRQEVKLFLCNSTRANDANVSQAIKDRFPRTGGGKNPAVGTKKQPGPLFGVKADIWAALGVALTYQAKLEGKWK